MTEVIPSNLRNLPCLWCDSLPINGVPNLPEERYSLGCVNEHCEIQPLVQARTSAETQRIWNKIVTPETTSPPDLSNPTDEQSQRLVDYVEAFENLKTKSPKELVDLVLEHVIDLKPFHELLVEELCSRVHPGWENDDSGVKTPSEGSL